MGNKQKRKRKRRQQRHHGHSPRIARNPGVSSLLLVNPAPAPKRLPPKAPSAASIKHEVNAAVATALKEREMPKPAKRPSVGPRPKRPKKRRRSSRRASAHTAPTVQIITGEGHTSVKPKIRHKKSNAEFDLNVTKQYRGLVPRKGLWRGKHPNRGIKTLEAHKKSILWNLGKGSPGAQQWVLDHIPKINPAGDMKDTAKDVGVGVASFLGARIVGNIAGKLPVLSHFGSLGSLGASAAVTGLSYFLLGKKWPRMKKPLLFGGLLALVDSVMKTFVVPHLPAKVAGVLGDADDAAFEPMGYLPSYDSTDGVGCYSDMDPDEWERYHQEVVRSRSLMGFDVHPAMADYDDGLGFDVHPAIADYDDGLGFDVHPAMADAGDGLGMEVHEAQAGVDDDLGAYVPTGTGAIDPSEGEYVADTGQGAYVPAPTGTGAYVPSMGEYVPTAGLGDAKEAAAMMFGGPMAMAQLRWLRRRHRHYHPGAHGRFTHPYPFPRRAHFYPRHRWRPLSREHAMMGIENPGPLPPHLRMSPEHHRHHGRHLHAECDFYLPPHHYRREWHRPIAPPLPHAPTVVAPPPALPTAKPPTPLTGVPGGIFSSNE